MIKSKAVESVNQLGASYWCARSRICLAQLPRARSLLGPYIEAQARTEFEELEPSTPVGRCARALVPTCCRRWAAPSAACATAASGSAVHTHCPCSHRLQIHFGRWLIDGYPHVVLFDVSKARGWLNEWKKVMRCCQRGRRHGAGSVREHGDWRSVGGRGVEQRDAVWLHGGVVLGRGRPVHALALPPDAAQFRFQNGDQPILAHFHEWLAGVGLVLCRVRHLPVRRAAPINVRSHRQIATVFTTHATLLGRYLCADVAIDFYNHLPYFDVDAVRAVREWSAADAPQEAGKRGIYHRYCMERAAGASAAAVPNPTPCSARGARVYHRVANHRRRGAAPAQAPPGRRHAQRYRMCSAAAL